MQSGNYFATPGEILESLISGFLMEHNLPEATLAREGDLGACSPRILGALKLNLEPSWYVFTMITNQMCPLL